MPSTLSVVETSPVREGATSPSSPATVNDLAIRVGTVNGSGSQSANLVLLRALYAMGIPCSGKNVFPSNIEGLPTWFHIRASAKGYVGHRLDPPVLVCMNEQTAKPTTSAQLKPGAICIYRDDFDVDLTQLRDDVQFFPVPFQKLVEKAYPAGQDRQGVSRQAPQGHQHGLRGGGRPRLRDRDGGGRGGHPPRVSRAARRRPPRSTSTPRGPASTGPRRTCPADLPFRVERMDATDGQDPDRGEQGRGPGRALRRDQRADLVSDHPVQQPGRVRRGVPQEAPGRRRTASGRSPSSRPRTSWRPSAWPSARAGPAPGR